MRYVSRIVEPAAGWGVDEVSAGIFAGSRGVFPADGSGVSLRRGAYAVLGCGGVDAVSSV